MWSTEVPTVKMWTFQTSQGPLHFHANREQLRVIGEAFLRAVETMPKPS
jgi:hypothetical protein